MHKINPNSTKEDIKKLLVDIGLLLDNQDLGKAFYQRLIDGSGIKLLDFTNISNNSFHVVTELPYKNGDEEFRPDITLLINGMPLVFIEVKKPNNRDGILAERNRIHSRCKNHLFRSFINITQIMIFSNNMEYIDGSPDQIEGAFYATSSYKDPVFNYFREEEILDLNKLLLAENDVIETEVLKDTNLLSIKHNPSFISNKSSNTPTNRICTSLLSYNRLFFLLRYAIAYVHDIDGLHKHIMRYPQIFATKAVQKKLDAGVRKGIIWHTQGSGKTALAYYNVHFLADYFQNLSVIPKFYFIVDRLDLLTQAQQEFSSRGLVVHTIESREGFAKDIKSSQVIHNHSGKREITVVNIQKFKDDPNVVNPQDYDINLQRIYFLDEVHRSYNPKGSFLANLCESDRNAIKIGLTGTPLLGNDYNSRSLFGDYIHKYYYNASIADGYTLRLIREEISTNYKRSLNEALETIRVKKGDIDRKDLYADERFVRPMLEYIIDDFEKSRRVFNDPSIGGMIICDSADQAKRMFELFQIRYTKNSTENFPETINNSSEIISKRNVLPNNNSINKADKYSVKNAALILHDVGTKDSRNDEVKDFKSGKVDLLFVYNMLLTGFDEKRLKKLYFGRRIQKHNLLQALTRVNRPFKSFRYGFVVDFADIRKEFDATNKAYFDELQAELGDEVEHYSHLFKTQDEISQEIEIIKDKLFRYDTENAEIFSQQISLIQDIPTIHALKKSLEDARSLYNLIRLQGEYSFLAKTDFNTLNQLYRETCNHLDLLNLKKNIESSTDNTNLLNIALEDVVFQFTKVKEEELLLADKLKDILRQTRETLSSNFDQNDPTFISLKEELARLFKKKKLNEVTTDEMNQNMECLKLIYDKAQKLNYDNDLLKAKFQGDPKYARIHKKILRWDTITFSERKLFSSLFGVKLKADKCIMQNAQILTNENFFQRMMMPIVIDEFKANNLDLKSAQLQAIIRLLTKEYVNEYESGNSLGATG
ncbi:type I restriction endonuclease subunit R [Candidatus Dojkabacteria bacterium]|uniref:type I site-specific deoxyribonuclease n=1 Tax=Candidatus Dojkabacteria bacterium TaxID=2099670 RepID=A0A955RHZ9_9BACT|nr:type I restriction endonuclease subunit R [Candidatus Dojkabacteria bacterium]